MYKKPGNCGFRALAFYSYKEIRFAHNNTKFYNLGKFSGVQTFYRQKTEARDFVFYAKNRR